jgi:pyruvate dehydrogenase E2 component (dihydrolipoamide acetyltransferase)
MAEEPQSTTSSPRARRRANQVGVDLNQLQGSGDHGRIIERDVLQASIRGSVSHGTTQESKPVATVVGQVSSMRRGIAERTALSFSQIPHFYLRMEADATELVKMREHLVAILEKECGVRITLTDFILRAQAKALGEFPAANAIWKDNGVVKFTDADVGVVVGLPDGLMIPVIRAAQNMSLVQIARERTSLVNAVRGGRYMPEAVSGGASSLSNLGASRTDEFTAIIPPHQSSILAVGRAAPRPYVVNSHLEIRTTLQLCLSMDHRVLDGGPAADFLGKIVELLENPNMLIKDI